MLLLEKYILEVLKSNQIQYFCKNNYSDGLYEYVPFERLLERSDFLVVVADANPGTVGVFNRAAFDRMKPDAVFINVARWETTMKNKII